MKQNLHSYGAGIVIAFGLASGAMATDYSTYTNEEMVQMRSQAREMSPQEHEAFRSEMQSRQRSMSPQERSRFREQNRMGGQGYRYGQSGNTAGMQRHGRGAGQGGGGGRGR